MNVWLTLKSGMETPCIPGITGGSGVVRSRPRANSSTFQTQPESVQLCSSRVSMLHLYNLLDLLFKGFCSGVCNTCLGCDVNTRLWNIKFILISAKHLFIFGEKNGEELKSIFQTKQLKGRGSGLWGLYSGPVPTSVEVHGWGTGSFIMNVASCH